MAQLPQTSQRDTYGYPQQPDSRRKLRNLVVHTSKRLLLTTIFVLLTCIGIALRLGRIFKRRTPLTPEQFHPAHILIIRLDLIGDLVLSLPVVRTLKRTYPHAQIDLLATPASAKILPADPDISEIITYDPNIWRRPKALVQRKNWREAAALRHRLRSRKYDLAVSVFGPWAAILAVLSGALRRIGFSKEGYPGFMTDPVPGQHWDEHDRLHEVDYCLQLAQAAGAHINAEDRIPRLTVSSQAREELTQVLLQYPLHTDRPLIVCHVASHNGQSKRWPVPYWAYLIDLLIQQDQANVILSGAPNDLPFITEVLQRVQEPPINLAGKTSLPQLAALLQRADLVISGDSGPMHIAAAVGTPLIAIHGPTDPALSGPVSPDATVLRSHIWCSPCYKAKGPADCPFFTTQCMKNILPRQVLTVIREQLNLRTSVPVQQEGQT